MKIDDKRVVLVTLEENEGLVVALNTGVSKAKGDYIVRMDSDDIAHPQRLEIQMNYLALNPEVDVLGTSTASFTSRPNSPGAKTTVKRIVRYKNSTQLLTKLEDK